ncbi:C-type lectin domain family 4 member E-like [Protopterus annectens]|uniref:C-type lectin domain family 4 member E-like n=1 Tax=Protopterus annectens TaxID=7888 RepID=UPI001CFAB069|nr:C-type lectin domain family 4 member E-like [Protopterus annectens]
MEQKYFLRRKQVEPCRSGWKKFMKSCYFNPTYTAGWATARRKCQKLSSDLVVITSAEEQKFLTSNYRSNNWIGLTDEAKEDVWLWIDGTLHRNSSGFWCKDEPNNTSNNNSNGENCAAIWALPPCQSEWKDENCFRSLNFICEKQTSCSCL